MNLTEPNLMGLQQSQSMGHAGEARRVDVDEMVAGFSMTPQMICKNVNDLAECGLLNQIHGSTVYPFTLSNFGYGSGRYLLQSRRPELLGGWLN